MRGSSAFLRAPRLSAQIIPAAASAIRHQYRVRSTQPIQQRDNRQARQRPAAQVSAVKPGNAPRLTRKHHRKQQPGQKKRTAAAR